MAMLHVTTAWTAGMLAAAAFAAVSCSVERAAPPSYHGMTLAPAKGKPDFTLTSMDGRPFHFRAETDGYLTFLYFGYTHCPDICPLHMANIAAVKKSLSPAEQARLRVVFVSTDPARDTPAQLRAWLGHFDSSFIGVRGPVPEINAIEQSMGLPPSERDTTAGNYGVSHAALMLAFTADDSMRLAYAYGVTRKDWADDIPRLLEIRPRRAAIKVRNALAPAPIITGAPAGASMAVYFTLENGGPADTIISAQSPVARYAIIHAAMSGGEMPAMDTAFTPVPVPANGTLSLVPGGMHLMLTSLGRAVNAGDSVPFTLTLRNGGTLRATARVVTYDSLQTLLAR